MILKFIYLRYKKEFHNLVVEDLLINIPNKVGKPAIEVLAPKREAVLKWLYYEANAVARRNPVDFGNLERRNGILIMIQALISAIGSSTFVEEKKPEEKKEVPAKPSWLENVDAFKNGVKPRVDNKAGQS